MKSLENFTCNETVRLHLESVTSRSSPVSFAGTHIRQLRSFLSIWLPTNYSPAWIVNSGSIVAPPPPVNKWHQMEISRYLVTAQMTPPSRSLAMSAGEGREDPAGSRRCARRGAGAEGGARRELRRRSPSVRDAASVCSSTPLWRHPVLLLFPSCMPNRFETDSSLPSRQCSTKTHPDPVYAARTRTWASISSPAVRRAIRRS